MFESNNKYLSTLKLMRLCVLEGKGKVIPAEAMKVLYL